MALSDFDPLITAAIGQIGLPTGLTAGDFFSLINAIIQQESTFNPNADTGVGVGLMQVVYDIWGATFGITRDQLFDPFTNIQIGATILRDYINSYGVQQGIAAYRGGPTGRFSSTAIAYANKIIGYWNSFKAKLRSLVTGTQYSYFVDPGTTGLTVSADEPYIEETTYMSPDPTTDGYSWGWLALIAFLVFMVADEII